MATFRKLQVVTQSNEFVTATKINVFPLIEPKDDELRIRVVYTGINMTDVNVCAGRYFADDEPPYDIGFESLGIIDAIGSKITENKYKIGQPVLVFDAERYDSFSEYLYKKVQCITPVPELKPEYLVALGSGLTATIGLDIAGRVKKGDKVLVVAAAGGTGMIAAQWAKHRGAYVIGTTSTEEKEKFLKEIGVDCVINYKKNSLTNVLSEKFPNGIDVIWETIGNESLKNLFEHLANRGRMVVIGSTYSYKNEGIAEVQIENWNAKLLRGSKSLNGFALFEYSELFDQYLTQLIDMISNGTIKVKVDLGHTSMEGKFVQLESIARAEEYLQNGKNIGKVIVQLVE